MSVQPTKPTRRRADSPLRRLARYFTDRRGAISPLLVLAMVPLIGALGVAIEASNWWLTQRTLQSAADGAALAASWNGGTTVATGDSGSGSSYSTSGCASTPDAFDCEAVAAAAKDGFTNGSNRVVVFPQYFASCSNPPLTGATPPPCYKVTINKQLPLYLLG